MDLDNAVLWNVAQGKESQAKVVEAGIGPDLLTKRGQRIWRFITDYITEHGDHPPPGVILEQTGAQLLEPENGIKLSWVAGQLIHRNIGQALEYGIGKGGEYLSRGQQDKATDIVLKLADHVREKRIQRAKVYTLGDVVGDVWTLYENTKNGVIGIPYPWDTMTAQTMGMWPGTLTFFVARPGLGKTFALINICWHARFDTKEKHKVLIVSPEMNRVELVERLVTRHGKFNYGDVVSAHLGIFGEKVFKTTIDELSAVDDFYILDDEDRLEPTYIEEAVEAVDPDLIAIDSIYMLKVADGKIKGGGKGSRYDRILTTVDWLRSWCRRVQKPIVAVSQLSRDGKVSRKDIELLKKGIGTGGLEDTLAMTDTLLWDVHNLFAMWQDRDMFLDKEMMFVPLKLRRQAKRSTVVCRWNMDEMDFSEIGTFVESKQDFTDEGFDDMVSAY